MIYLKKHLFIITICATRSITKEKIPATLLAAFSPADDNVRWKFSLSVIPIVIPANHP